MLFCAPLQGQPVAEVNVTAGVVSMAFDDHQSQDADARNTHLKLRGQKLDLLVEVMQDAIATKVSYFNVKSLSHTCIGLMETALRDMSVIDCMNLNVITFWEYGSSGLTHSYHKVTVRVVGLLSLKRHLVTACDAHFAS